jgi:proline iminopeptidase
MKKKRLLAFSSVAIVFAVWCVWTSKQVRATAQEAAIHLDGDALIPNPIGVVNNAITIGRPPQAVWPWLAQMGAGRAGWYSYDFIDNGGRPSAERILPEYQKVSTGAIFPAVPGARDVFVVARCNPEHSLVLAWRLSDGRFQTTWAFVLEPLPSGRTRLLVRGRVAPGYHPYGLPQWLALYLGRPAHFIMQRKQMVNIKRRVEAGP